MYMYSAENSNLFSFVPVPAYLQFPRYSFTKCKERDVLTNGGTETDDLPTCIGDFEVHFCYCRESGEQVCLTDCG